jgi:TonB family protein
MQNRLLALFFAMFCSMATAIVMPQAAAAQGPVARVVPTKVERPVYPMIARSARVRGVVVINVYVRRDGSVDSASVLQRIPLLEDAARKAAWLSEFECRDCTAELTPYTLVYAFEMDAVETLPSVNDIAATAFQTLIRTGARPAALEPSMATVARR